jgi:hypothetical protein
MTRSALTTTDPDAVAGEAGSGRVRRAGRNLKIVLGLLAIYGPVALVLATHRSVLGKVYLVIGIWAIEGIVWYWHDGHSARRARLQQQAAGEPIALGDCPPERLQAP